MKDLLQFLQKRLSEEIENQDSPDYTSMDSKLEYIYEDLLSKTNDALQELSGGEINFDTGISTGDIDFRGGGITANGTDESGTISIDEDGEDSFQSYQRQAQAQVDNVEIPDAFDGTREEFAEFAENFKNLTGREIPDQWNSSQEIFTGPEENQPDFDTKDEQHAQRDGSKESFDELRKNIQNFTAKDFDPKRLRKLANVAEAVEGPGDIDPRGMSDDEFGKLLSRLQPNLIDWATGKKENLVEKLDQAEIANEIQNALHRAQQESNGNIDMLRSFQEHVSDSIFDTSRNMDDGYAPEYDNQEDLQHPSTLDETPEKDVTHGTEPTHSQTGL